MQKGTEMEKPKSIFAGADIVASFILFADGALWCDAAGSHRTLGAVLFVVSALVVAGFRFMVTLRREQLVNSQHQLIERQLQLLDKQHDVAADLLLREAARRQANGQA